MRQFKKKIEYKLLRNAGCIKSLRSSQLQYKKGVRRLCCCVYQCNLGNVAAFSFSKNCNMAGRTTYGNHYIFLFILFPFFRFLCHGSIFFGIVILLSVVFHFPSPLLPAEGLYFFQKVFIFMDYGNKTLNEAYSCNTHPKLSDILSIQFGWRLLRIICNLLSCPPFNV